MQRKDSLSKCKVPLLTRVEKRIEECKDRPEALAELTALYDYLKRIGPGPLGNDIETRESLHLLNIVEKHNLTKKRPSITKRPSQSKSKSQASPSSMPPPPGGTGALPGMMPRGPATQGYGSVLPPGSMPGSGMQMPSGPPPTTKAKAPSKRKPKADTDGTKKAASPAKRKAMGSPGSVSSSKPPKKKANTTKKGAANASGYGNAGGANLASSGPKSVSTKKDAEIAAKMQQDQDLSLITESTNQMEEKEYDVLYYTDVDDNEELQKMLPPQSLIEMTDAERELENWPNTHVIGPDRINEIVDEVGTEFAPKIGFGSDLERASLVEYLARGFQELLCTMLPDLIDIAKHGQSNPPQSETHPQSENSISSEKVRKVQVESCDLDIYCGVSRTLSRKVDHLIGESLDSLNTPTISNTPQSDLPQES